MTLINKYKDAPTGSWKAHRDVAAPLEEEMKYWRNLFASLGCALGPASSLAWMVDEDVEHAQFDKMFWGIRSGGEDYTLELKNQGD